MVSTPASCSGIVRAGIVVSHASARELTTPAHSSASPPAKTSKPMRITVTKQNKGVKPADLLGPPRIEVLGAAERGTVQLPMRMQFHASGYNVSHAGPKVDGTGHFRLTLERSGQKPEVIELDGGQTEVWLSPPRGDYGARLELVANADGKPMARAKPVSFTVP